MFGAPYTYVPEKASARSKGIAILVSVFLLGFFGTSMLREMQVGSTSSVVSGTKAPLSPTTSAVVAKVVPGVVDVHVSYITKGVTVGGAEGTGMILTKSGEVLTNNHVIDGEGGISVTLPATGKSYNAHLLGYDAADDVALLQIDGGGTFTPLQFGNSTKTAVGTPVITLGNAQGKGGPPSVTTGSVTGLNQAITASDSSGVAVEKISGLMQISAPIQPGDSGGPLTNNSGTVIGMDTAADIAPNAAQYAYAIPINTALMVAHQINSGHSTTTVHVGTKRALLGVTVAEAPAGVRIATVDPGSPAEKAGLLPGDVIVSVDGKNIDTQITLRTLLIEHNPGDSVSLSWLDAQNQSHTAQVTLENGPPA